MAELTLKNIVIGIGEHGEFDAAAMFIDTDGMSTTKKYPAADVTELKILIERIVGATYTQTISEVARKL